MPNTYHQTLPYIKITGLDEFFFSRSSEYPEVPGPDLSYSSGKATGKSICQADFPKRLLLSKGSCTPSAESQMLTSNVCNKVRVYLQKLSKWKEKQVSIHSNLVFELDVLKGRCELGMIIIFGNISVTFLFKTDKKNICITIEFTQVWL